LLSTRWISAEDQRPNGSKLGLASCDDRTGLDEPIMARHLERFRSRCRVLLHEQQWIFQFGNLVAAPRHLLEREPVSGAVLFLIVGEREPRRHRPRIFGRPEPRNEDGLVVAYSGFGLLPAFVEFTTNPVSCTLEDNFRAGEVWDSLDDTSEVSGGVWPKSHF
jgi:hypothetical protein